MARLMPGPNELQKPQIKELMPWCIPEHRAYFLARRWTVIHDPKSFACPSTNDMDDVCPTYLQRCILHLPNFWNICNFEAQTASRASLFPLTHAPSWFFWGTQSALEMGQKYQRDTDPKALTEKLHWSMQLRPRSCWPTNAGKVRGPRCSPVKSLNFCLSLLTSVSSSCTCSGVNLPLAWSWWTSQRNDWSDCKPADSGGMHLSSRIGTASESVSWMCTGLWCANWCSGGWCCVWRDREKCTQMMRILLWDRMHLIFKTFPFISSLLCICAMRCWSSIETWHTSAIQSLERLGTFGESSRIFGMQSIWHSFATPNKMDSTSEIVVSFDKECRTKVQFLVLSITSSRSLVSPPWHLASSKWTQ